MSDFLKPRPLTPQQLNQILDTFKSNGYIPARVRMWIIDMVPEFTELREEFDKAVAALLDATVEKANAKADLDKLRNLAISAFNTENPLAITAIKQELGLEVKV